MNSSIIVLVIFVIIGYILGVTMKIRGKAVPALLLALLLMYEFFIKDIRLFTISSVNVGLITILEGLTAGFVFRSILK